jgi:hypothetical protein
MADYPNRQKQMSFNQFFTDKVAKLHDYDGSSDPPMLSQVRPGALFRSFRQVSIEDATSAISTAFQTSHLPLTHCRRHGVADLFAPFLNILFHRSVAAGQFPAVFKEAFITPIVKKAGVDDAADVNSHRPISNLAVLSNLFEPPVAHQLTEYLTVAGLLPSRKSGLRSVRSIEIAVLGVGL